MKIGDAARLSRIFTREDLESYAELTGDRIAGDPPEVPPMLLGGLISRLLGVELPGRGTNWMKQRFRYHRSATIGEEVTAQVEVVRLRPEKDLVNLRTILTGNNGALIAEGEALVMAREML